MIAERNRRPAGTPTGGQFAPSAHPESEVSLGADDGENRPPLADYRVVGFARKEYRAPPAPRPSPGRHGGTAGRGSSTPCGCATTRPARSTMAERYAVAGSEALALRQRAEEEAEALHGPHGTEGRYLGGCRCDACTPAAPHGSLDRLEAGRCRCAACVDGAVASGWYRRQPVRVLVDAATGEVLPARSVSTRFGLRWVLDRDDGAASWFPYAPARRSTLASKGVVEAEVEHLVRPYRRGGFETI